MQTRSWSNVLLKNDASYAETARVPASPLNAFIAQKHAQFKDRGSQGQNRGEESVKLQGDGAAVINERLDADCLINKFVRSSISCYFVPSTCFHC